GLDELVLVRGGERDVHLSLGTEGPVGLAGALCSRAEAAETVRGKQPGVIGQQLREPLRTAVLGAGQTGGEALRDQIGAPDTAVEEGPAGEDRRWARAISNQIAEVVLGVAGGVKNLDFENAHLEPVA